eukprot:ctg_1464.g436
MATQRQRISPVGLALGACRHLVTAVHSPHVLQQRALRGGGVTALLTHVATHSDMHAFFVLATLITGRERARTERAGVRAVTTVHAAPVQFETLGGAVFGIALGTYILVAAFMHSANVFAHTATLPELQAALRTLEFANVQVHHAHVLVEAGSGGQHSTARRTHTATFCGRRQRTDHLRLAARISGRLRRGHCGGAAGEARARRTDVAGLGPAAAPTGPRTRAGARFQQAAGCSRSQRRRAHRLMVE